MDSAVNTARFGKNLLRRNTENQNLGLWVNHEFAALCSQLLFGAFRGYAAKRIQQYPVFWKYCCLITLTKQHPDNHKNNDCTQATTT